MRRAQTKSTAEAGFEELISLVNSRSRELAPFTRMRLEKAARDGMRADPEFAYQILGILAGTQWDIEQMKTHFQNALRYASSAAVNANYGTALLSVSDLAGSAQQAELASKLEPTNLAYLRNAIEVHWSAGRWAQALELQRQCMERSPGDDRPDFMHHQDAVDVLHEYGVSFDTIETLHETVYNFLRSRRVHVIGTESFIDRTPGDETVYVTITVPGDTECVRGLDEELTGVLFDAVDDLPLGTFSISLGAEVAANDA